MYRKHFALTAFPFDLTPEPDALFASASLGKAEARLKHLLELRGIGLITGEAGTGKTTVARLMGEVFRALGLLARGQPLSTGNMMDMYKSIGWELGLPTERNRPAAFRVIRSEVTRLTLEAKQRPLLIVDEAHQLADIASQFFGQSFSSRQVLDLRLCLLLVGLTELRRRLAMAVHESLAQRIVAFDAFLKGLRANLNPSVTEAEAIEMLAQHVLTRPVFEALFQGYAFTAENPVSKAMEGVIAHMDAVSVGSETETLEKFYDAIRERVSLAKSDKSRQQVIRNLYDTFFNNAFPRMAERASGRATARRSSRCSSTSSLPIPHSSIYSSSTTNCPSDPRRRAAQPAGNFLPPNHTERAVTPASDLPVPA